MNATAWGDLLGVLLEGMPEHIYFKDSSGRFTAISRSVVECLGLTDVNQVLNKTAFEFCEPDDAREIQRLEQEVMRTGQPLIEHEERRVCRDGMVHYFMTTKVPVREADRGIVGIAAISRDITPRKKAESSLRESEERFRRIFESDMVGVHFWDADGTVTEANDAYLRMVGYTRADLTARRVRWRELTPPQYAALDDQALAHMKRSGACPPFEKEYVRKDGSRLPVLLSAALLPESQHQGVAFALDLTELKRAEQALHEQRQQQEIILDSVPAMIWYKDRENRIIRANRTAAASGGMTKDQIEGQSTYDVYPEHAAAYHRDDLEVINSGRPKMGIVEQIDIAGGETRWVRTDKIPYRNKDGAIIGVIVFANDITELKQTESALRESESLFRTLAENSSVGIWRITPDGHTLYLNPAMCRMLEIDDPREMQGRTYHDFFAPESHEIFKREHAKRAAGLPSTYEVEIIGQHGTQRNIMISGSPLMNADGTLSSLIATVTDITERKRAETALRHEQYLLQILMDNMPDAIYFKDLESRFLRTNNAHAHIMGLKNPQEAIGKTDVEFFVPEAAARFRADELRVITTGESVINRIEHHGKPIETTRWFSTTKVPIHDESGNITGTAGISRDITHLKHVEDRIRSMNEELERRVADRTAKLESTNRQLEAEIVERREAQRKVGTYQERLRSLASELSLAEERERRRIAIELHDDIGQSLALIQIKLQKLRESASPELAVGLNQCVDLLGQPIRDVRSLVFNLSPPVLYDLGFEAAAAWLAEQHDNNTGLRVKFSDDQQPKPLDQAVAVILFRAIRELLTNVAKHSQARNARVWLKRQNSSLCVGVEDDGRGFDPAVLGTYTAQSGGFGLFSIREQLDRLGGSLHVDSAPGRGSRIMLKVPLKRHSPDPEGGPSHGRKNPAG